MSDHSDESGIDGQLTEKQDGGTVSRVVRLSRRYAGGAREQLRIKLEGLENLPDEGAVLLASNQPWNSAARIVAGALPRPVSIAARDELFTGSSRLDALRRRMLVARKRTPLEPVPEAVAAKSAVELLATGAVVLILPEGGPTPDGALHRGHPEVAWLAVTARMPVIPLALIPTDGPGAGIVPRVIGPTLRLGEQLDFSRFWTSPALSPQLDRVILRGITDEIMDAIRVLGGLDYRDSYHDLARLQVHRQKSRDRRNRWRNQVDVDRQAHREWVAQDEADDRAAMALARKMAQAEAARLADADGQRRQRRSSDQVEGSSDQ